MSDIWKVFVPYQLLSVHCGYFIGYIHEGIRCVYAHCMNTEEQKPLVLPPLQVIGTWHTSNTEYRSKHDQNITPLLTDDKSLKFWLVMQEKSSRIFSCCFYKFQKGRKVKLKCHLILYNPTDILSSYIICNKSKNLLEQNKSNDSKESSMEIFKPLNLEKLQISSLESTETVSGLVSTLYMFKNFMTEKNRDHCITWTKSRGFWLSWLSKWFCYIIQCFSGILLYIGGMLDNLFRNHSLLAYWTDVPMLTHQLQVKYHQRKTMNTAFTSVSTPLNKLFFADVCWQQLIDTMLGVVLMVFMMQEGMADTFADFLINWADEVGRSLTNLINWLMGAPAGLKLNSQLTRFLGHFFLYHIYLWAGYLSVLRPVLGNILYYSSTLGLMGFSMQLCLVQDIFSMLTLHIYCFYVYAARLYSLQVFALASLWRLFRGKKWNVLRTRVDSVSYDIDQLFIGTLFFTILLFLLPTMLLYYTVFLVLRLGVLFVKTVLSFCVRVIITAPVFTLFLWIIRSKAVTGDVRFTVVPNSCMESSLIFTMQTSHISLRKLWKLTKTESVLECQNETGSMMKLLHSMITGHLIYPWIQNSPIEKKEKNS